MGGKKRNLESIEEQKNETQTSYEEVELKPSKMLKKYKKEDEGSKPTSINPSSGKPMERRKKRKAMDKERHINSTENVVVKKVKETSDEGDNKEDLAEAHSASSSSTCSPQFHISVFKDLGSVDFSTRVTAAETLVRELQQVQNAYEKLGKQETESTELQLEAEKDDGLQNCATSLRYAIRRLIRGVSSSRECARQGFALGLSLVVGTIPCINLGALLKLITDILDVTSSMKGQEARDCFLGRLFAYSALARSGRITEEWISNSSADYVKELCGLIIELASKKRYLREPAVSIILDLVEKLPVEALTSQILQAPGMVEWFKDATEVGNPEALLMALKMREKMASDNEIFSKLLPYPFSRNKIFTAEHLSSLILCFNESTFCQPRVHSVWPVVANILLPDTSTQDEDAISGLSSSKKHKKNRKYSSYEEVIAKNLRCFCEIVVEGCLLPSSHDRKHLAFDILLLLLPRLPASCVEIILSFKVVHCLMDILSTKDSWLYKTAHYFLKEISEWVKNDDGRRVEVVVALQKHSGGKFDCITKTKTIKGLVGEFDTESGCTLFVQNLVSMFIDVGPAPNKPLDQSQTTDDNSDMGSIEDKDSAGMRNQDSLKSWVIHSLPCVLKDLKVEPMAKFRVQKEILKFLAVQGLFSPSLGSELASFELHEKFIWPKSATSTALCNICIEQLQLLLANAEKEGTICSRNSDEANDLGSYFMRVLRIFCNMPSVSIFRTLSEEDENAFKELQAMETYLSQKERHIYPGTKAADKLHAFRYLLIQLLLQVLLRPGEFHEAALELTMCCKNSFPSPDLDSSEDDSDSSEDDCDSSEDDLYSSEDDRGLAEEDRGLSEEYRGPSEEDRDSSEENEEKDDNEIPQLMNVLVDTLLSLLPQSSPPLRLSVEQVFKLYCNAVTEAGLIRMLRIIKKDLIPPRHQASYSESDDEDEDEDFLGIEEDEETDNLKTIYSDELDDDFEALAQIRASGKEVTEASDDESHGEMDDDAMFRMDSYLAQIFRERTQAGGETAHSQLVLFKLRVLSLIEIYLHENPGSSEVVTVYSYLAEAFVNIADTSDQLAQRIWGILQKKIFKSTETPNGKDIRFSTLESLLKRNLKLASKPFKKKKSAATLSNKKQQAPLARHKMVISLAQHSTFWLLKIVRTKRLRKNKLKELLKIFQQVLVEYFDSKKSRLKPGFVREVFQRQPWLGHKLFHFLLEKCGCAKSEFRRTKALDLVDGILKSLVSKKEGTDGKTTLKKILKKRMPLLVDLISKLVIDMPQKQSLRAQVRRFCAKTFKVLSMLNLRRRFRKSLSKEAYDACESQLGDLFLSLKKSQKVVLI